MLSGSRARSGLRINELSTVQPGNLQHSSWASHVSVLRSFDQLSGWGKGWVAWERGMERAGGAWSPGASLAKSCARTAVSSARRYEGCLTWHSAEYLVRRISRMRKRPATC